MVDSTINERATRYRQRSKERGLVHVKVIIPESKRDQLLKLCERWRKAELKECD